MIGRRVVIKLARSRNPSIPVHDEQQPHTTLHCRKHIIDPECLAFFLRERQHKSDAGPVMDACMQQRAKFADIVGDIVGREDRNGGLWVSRHGSSHDKENVFGRAMLGSFE